MRKIIRAESIEEAVKLRHEIENSAYLAGGTEVMRLGSSVDEDAVLIDINSLPLSGIRKENGKVIIGALTTLQEIKESELVPSFIREAAAFAASLQLRNAATIAMHCYDHVHERKEGEEYFGILREEGMQSSCHELRHRREQNRFGQTHRKGIAHACCSYKSRKLRMLGIYRIWIRNCVWP